MAQFAVEEDILCIAHHPDEAQFAISLVTGHVHAYRYTPGDLSTRQEIWSTKRHKKACRSLCYSPSGRHLVSVGADKVIKLAVAGSGKVVQKWVNAHEETINAVSFINEETFCTADDDGIIKAWNTTSAVATREYVTHDDYVSSLLPLEGKFVASTSGDGTISIHDLRNNQFSNDAARATKDGWTRISKACTKRSDDQEDDLLCSLVLKRGKKDKLVVGTSSGVVLIFDRNDVGDCNDRILSPPSLDAAKGKKKKKKNGKSEEEEIGVECMAKVDESRIVVGGSDGAVRLLQVLPNRYLRVIGDFESGEPVEGVVMHDGYVIAVSGADVRSWSIEEPDPAPSIMHTKVKDEQDSGGDDDNDDDNDKSEDDSNDSNDNDESSDKDRQEIKHSKSKIKREVEEESDGDQFSDSDSDAAPKKKKPKKVKPNMMGKKNTFFDDL